MPEITVGSVWKLKTGSDTAVVKFVGEGRVLFERHDSERWFLLNVEVFLDCYEPLPPFTLKPQTWYVRRDGKPAWCLGMTPFVEQWLVAHPVGNHYHKSDGSIYNATRQCDLIREWSGPPPKSWDERQEP